MFDIIDKLYKNSKSLLFQDILDFYHTNGYTIVNYLYGANLVRQNLLEDGSIIDTSCGSYNFKQVLLDGSFLLPDGAAIRTMRKIGRGLHRFQGPSTIPNLNGTDFLPYFIDNLIDKVGHDHIYIHFLTVYDEKIGNPKGYLFNKCKHYINSRFGINYNHIIGHEIDYSNQDYKNWSGWDDISYKTYDGGSYNLFLNFRGTPHQEIWTHLNIDLIKKNRLLVFDQGGTVDFRAGKEFRAPMLIRKLWLESIWRLIQYPKKNWKKFFVSFKMIGLIIKKIILRCK